MDGRHCLCLFIPAKEHLPIRSCDNRLYITGIVHRMCEMCRFAMQCVAVGFALIETCKICDRGQISVIRFAYTWITHLDNHLIH